jgi:hypothetical protein
VSLKWDFLRIAAFYGPVWLIITTTFSIYIYAGREIFQKRRQLRSFAATPPYPILENPFVSCKTTEVKITSELADLPNLNPSQISFRMDSHGRTHSTQGYDQYSITIETTSKPSPGRVTASSASSRDTTYHHRVAAMEANNAAWSYTKCALLFFVSLLVTWVCISTPFSRYNNSQSKQVPSTINRVYSFVHPEVVSFPLSFASALVLPLQGWWNFVVYVTTSLPATKALLHKSYFLVTRKEPASATAKSRGSQASTASINVKRDQDTQSGTDSCADSMKGFARVSHNYMTMNKQQYPLSP